MGRWSNMYQPDTLPDEHGVVHAVQYLDAVYWRPFCSRVPSTKPKGWTKMCNLHVTCLVCASDMATDWAFA